MAKSFRQQLEDIKRYGKIQPEAEIPGRTVDFAGAAEKRIDPAFSGTSTFRPERAAAPQNMPGFDAPADNATGKAGNIARNLVTGAAYGMQTNVGYIPPGQEWRAGLLKGISGAGLAAAARSRNEALQGKGEADFASRVALLRLKDSLAPTAEDKLAEYEGKLAVRQPYLEQSIEARRKADMQRVRDTKALEKASGWNDKDLMRMRLDLNDKFNQMHPNASDEERRVAVEKQYNDILTGVNKYQPVSFDENA